MKKHKLIFYMLIITANLNLAAVALAQDQNVNSSNKTTSVKNHNVTGIVTDINGEPIIGVSIIETGTTNGTITNYSGTYSLTLTKDNTHLKFSYIGYNDKIIEVKPNESLVNVVLSEQSKLLDELVVVGYGTMKKSDLTGSVASVGGDIIEKSQATQISQALQGAMPGVMVTRTNSAPGASSTIRIRGITTIGENDPLVIVDGVPLLGINDINPNDIESISVLKDAASASIYGARAAAGVILVTTKRGKTGGVNLQYNAEFGVEKPTVLSEYVGAQRYMEMVNELRWNDNGNISGSEYLVYEPEIIENYTTLHNDNPDRYPLTNWVDLILKKYAPKQSHNVSITAGNKTLQSKISLAYDNVDGLYAGKSYERITARINNDININKHLSSSVDFFIKRSMYDDPSTNPIGEMRLFPSIYSAVWSNGLISEGKGGQNPYARLMYGGYDETTYNQFGGKASLTYSPIQELNFSVVVSSLLNNNKEKQVRKQIQYTYYDDPDVYLGFISGATSNSLKESRTDSYRLTTQFIANYKKTFEHHDLNIMSGFESFQAYNENMSAYSNNMQFSDFPYLDLANTNYISVSGDAYESAYNSYFGRIAYSYNNRYLAQVNARYDGSSRFDKDFRWGFFPSLSVGWVMSEESFMKGIDPLSFLKLRASWGKLGNERIGNYPYQSTIEFSNALFYSGDNVVSSQTARQVAYAIKNITWETTESIDLGIDINLFDNRLQLSGDYYDKNTDNMLLSLEIPDYIGFTNPEQNAGKMNTKGWELEIKWQDQIRDFKYSVSANLSDFRSVMVDLGGIEFLGDQVKIKGSEYNEWYGYKTDGIFQTQEEIDNYPTLNTNVKPGDIKLLDISGPDGVPDGVISADYDRTLLGGSLPRYIYGGNANIGYKNLDLSFTIQGVGKQNSRMTAVMVQPLRSDYGNFPAFIDNNYWSTYNSIEKNNTVKYPRLSATSSSNNYSMSDYWLFNGAYFRIKNITLGYNLPHSWVENIQMKDIRLYISGVDLFSINNYPKGWDPEISDTGYPITASFIFGISVKF
ncbi:MAG: TonB-dependent receptor [Paludibacter sp.]|nr:TonB-dependent receptor [Paludibacter sp.]